MRETASERSTALATHWHENLIAVPRLSAALHAGRPPRRETNRMVLPPGHRKFAKENTFAPATIPLPDEPEIVSHPVLLLGTALRNYGHFLTNSMSRMWAALKSDLACLFLCAEDLTEPFHTAIVEALGLSIVSPSRPTLYRRVLVPEPNMTRDVSIMPHADIAHLRVTDALYPPAAKRSGSRVFLSRPGYPSNLRVTDEAGEVALQRAMLEAGFRAVRPDTLTFAEEIAIFNESEVIVGIFGSAFLTSMFSRRDYEGRLVMLTTKRDDNRFALVQSLKSYSRDSVQCVTVRGYAPRYMEVDVDLAMRQLAKLGVV